MAPVRRGLPGCRHFTMPMLRGEACRRKAARIEHANEQQASRNRRVAFGLPQRSCDQRRGGSDLPDHQLPVPRHQARRQPVRPGRARQHLHPHHEPDQRRAGDADRGARGRRGRAGAGLGAGGLAVCRPEHLPRRRQFRRLDGSLRRYLEPVRQHHEDDGHRMPLRRSGRPGEFPPRHRRQDPLLLCRDAAQPQADRVPDRRGGEASAASSACR